MGFLCHQCIFSAWKISLNNSSSCGILSKRYLSWHVKNQGRIKAWFSQAWICCQSPVEPARPRFRIKEEEHHSLEQVQQDEMESINNQLKKEILETKKRLGLEEKPVQPRKELLQTDNVEEVSLGSTLVASIIAGLLAVLFDMFAFKVYNYFGTHPTSQTDMYIIARLSSVIRLVLVGFSTLAGGIVSIVAFGLILLFLQTSLKRLMDLLST
ncbi:hypothetical protein GpartN1_g1553.t1 [Galdieria partita]|uniref:DUF3082 domain-containing protein n=1 Tax=Galdieria partita TaxID=83374 RepID=A0A9C7PUC5_9RHOD|nr:hypothetical protein GpartN1_g1553.t1 [Galdieria partita]